MSVNCKDKMKRRIFNVTGGTYKKVVVKFSHKIPFVLSDFLDGNFVVCCDTQEKSNDFLQKCTNCGLTWCNNDPLIGRTNWGEYRENTTYRYSRSHGGMKYDNKNYYLENDYTVINYDIDMWEE